MRPSIRAAAGALCVLVGAVLIVAAPAIASGDQPELVEEQGDELVRVCHLQDGKFFSHWTTIKVTLEEAEWYEANYEADSLAIEGKPCKVSDPVLICEFNESGSKVSKLPPDEASWILENGKGALLEDGKCGEVKTGNETGGDDGKGEEPSDDGGAADDGAPADDGTAADDGAPADDGTAADDGAPADDGTTADDGTAADDGGAPADDPADDATAAADSTVDDSADQPEVLGQTVTRQETQLARTGFDAGDLMLFGTVLLGSGVMLVSSPSLRRKVT